MARLNFVFLALFLVTATAQAQGGRQPRYQYEQPEADHKGEGGVRAEHWSGFDLGVGLPFPSFVGGMLGFNIGDDARLSGGAGIFGKHTTYQLDAKVFLGKAAWAGYFGAGLDYMYGTPEKLGSWQLDFNALWVPYMQVGVDFQSDMGVHVSFNLAGAVPHGTLIVLPGLAIGWYF